MAFTEQKLLFPPAAKLKLMKVLFPFLFGSKEFGTNDKKYLLDRTMYHTKLLPI